ncbi:flocculation protein FLO11-like [Chelonus insularis]|uniref:flocculation protein FLO11-like n=1 Tax=Chelonus insularis TaxID=460826 RepID=UPI00158C5A45|nr:flocculation protein FLO11-like [Chelonus insularis]
MIPHVCQFLLVLLNGCNNITSTFPQVTNSNGTYQIQSSGCNCSCTNYPNILNLCQLSNVTIPPCATTVSDVSEPTSLLSTTPGLTTLTTEEDDDDIFNDQARKKKTTTSMPTSLASTTTLNPITGNIQSTNMLITDSEMTPNPPDSSNLQKDNSSTQTTIDVKEFSTTPSLSSGSTKDIPLLKTMSTPVALESSTEKTAITEKDTTSPRSTTGIDSRLLTENELTSTSSGTTTTSPGEHVSPGDQSSTSPSISTIQSSTSSKTSESSISGSSTPRYKLSTVPEENTPTKDNSDNTSSTKSLSTSTLSIDVTTKTFQTSTMDRKSTTSVDYISSTQNQNEEKITTPLFTTIETSTTLSANNRSSPNPCDTTGLSTKSEKKEEDRSTTVKYSMTDASTLTTQYDHISTDSSVKSSVYSDATPYRVTLLPTMTTEEEDDEIFNDKAGKKKQTTKTPTTLEFIESSSTPYLMSRATSELTTESPDIITTTWSTTDLVSTTQPSNDSYCDLTDQSTDKSIDPMNNTELTSLRRVKRSLFNYGVKLSEVLLKDDKSNVALSPINFALLLAMVRSGCRSPMKEEFDKVLDLSFYPNDNRLKLFKSIVDSVNNITNNSSVEIYMANKIYLPNDVDVNRRFIKLTGIIFQSEPQTIDFQDINSTVQQLNNWSSNRTNDKIPVFIDSNHLNSSTSVLLTSVTYFSGNWSNPFDRQFTSKNLFYVNDNTTKKVCTMIQVNKFRYGQLPDLKAEFVELPFESGDNNSLSMIIMLPTNGTSLNTVVERLNELTYSQLTANSSIEVVELSLPKFRIENVIDLAEKPEDFGLTNITNDSNDFKCVVESKPLRISHIIQKTVIDVHEGGCWKVPMNYICPKEVHSCSNTSSIKFVVNQPFIILVVSSDMILFSGRVNDPSLKSVNTKV